MAISAKDPARKSLRDRFIASHGHAPEHFVALPQDASFRRYYRLMADPPGGTLGEGSISDGGGDALPAPALLCVDAPPSHERLAEYIKVNKLLRAMGMRVPDVASYDTGLGFALIEDFGDHTVTRLLAEGESEQTLYEAATDCLIRLHSADQAQAERALGRYDMPALLREVELFTKWFLPTLLPQLEIDAGFMRRWQSAWQSALARCAKEHDVLVLRDFHVDNLMRVEGEPEALGLLDFQDALFGCRAYDIVGLLEDARRDVSEALRAAMITRYLEAMPSVDRRALDADIACLGAQRHAKVAGIFMRLALRDHKYGYLRHIPRVVGLLQRSLTHPALAPVSLFFETELPHKWADLALGALRPLAARAG